MNRDQFLFQLESLIKRLPAEERQDIMQDFEEHFALGAMEGKTDEEISASLGSPQQIAKELLVSYHLEKVENTATAGNVVRAVWAVIGLGFFNLVIVLGPFIALLGLLFAGWVISITFVASPLLILLDTVLHPELFVPFELFLSIMLAGLGFFVGIGMYHVTRFLTKGFIRYLKFNVNLVKGGMKHA